MIAAWYGFSSSTATSFVDSVLLVEVESGTLLARPHLVAVFFRHQQKGSLVLTTSIRLYRDRETCGVCVLAKSCGEVRDVRKAREAECLLFRIARSVSRSVKCREYAPLEQ